MAPPKTPFLRGMTTWGWENSGLGLTGKIGVLREPSVTVQPARDYIRDYNRKRPKPKTDGRAGDLQKCPRAMRRELGFRKWSCGCGRSGTRDCQCRRSSICGTN